MTHVVSVCDRESDVYEYMNYKVNQKQRFVIRATQSRKVENSSSRLFELPQQLKAAGERTIQVEQKGGRVARKAQMKLFYAQTTILPPKGKSGEALPLYYVCCKEDGEESDLCWHLLTTEKVENTQQAQQIVEAYEQRWLIEDYHKAWKTGGTQVEDLRMQSLDNLERMITVLSFVACRILQLKFIGLQGKAAPEQSCEVILQPIEWKLLWLKKEKGKKPPKKPPPMYWAYKALAGLGGWQDSKRTGRAGWQVLWEGWYKLQVLVEGYELACSLKLEM